MTQATLLYLSTNRKTAVDDGGDAIRETAVPWPTPREGGSARSGREEPERGSARRAVWRPQTAYLVVSPAWRGEHECIVQLCKGIQAWACLSSLRALGSLEQPIGVTGSLSGTTAVDDTPAYYGWHSPVDPYTGCRSRRHEKASPMLPPTAAGDLWVVGGCVINMSGSLPDPTSRRLGPG